MEEKIQVSFQDTRKANFKPSTNCRVCDSSDLELYLDLGMLPLPNNLEITNAQAKAKQRFPLQVMFCNNCSLSQLSVIVDPEEMFSYYTYRSSINAGYVKHCREMAIQLKHKYNLDNNSKHIDIAGNDGALLREFKEEIGLAVLNIDPAKNLCKISESIGVSAIPEFWSNDLAKNFTETIDLITATNVFAHVDNVKDFITGARTALKMNGILILEFPYIVDFIEGFEMDTVYFEHLSYFSIIPLTRLCSELNMKIINVEKFSIHGGTVRVTITNEESHHQIESSVSKFINHELSGGFTTIDKYTDWAIKSHSIIQNFREQILNLKTNGKKIWAFAASAKGNTLLNCAGIDNDIIDVIIDETPEKFYKYSPGTGIMIKGFESFDNYNHPDYIIILSWNFKEEIIQKLRKVYKGKFIIPIPEFTII